MPVTVYNVAKLYWTARNGASEMRQGNAAIMAKRLETLRCPARLVLLDGTLIGGCQRTDGSQTCKRLKWANGGTITSVRVSAHLSKLSKLTAMESTLF